MEKYWPESRCKGKENIWYAIDTTTEENIILKFFTISTSDEYKVSREAYTMQCLYKEDPKHFLEMYDFMIDKSEDQYSIAMEKAECSLEDFVEENGYLSEEVAIPILREILNALNVMHKNHFIHRDLKLSNILLKDKNDPTSIKIIDFGETVERSDNDDITGMVGTLQYMAPEILEKKPYSKPVDIWAFGIITYRILTGYFPYNVEKYNPWGQLNVIYKNDLSYLTLDNKKLSPNAIDFINNILNLKPKNRISINAALEHPFLNPNFEDHKFNKNSNASTFNSENNDLINEESIMKNTEDDCIVILQENQESEEDIISNNSSSDIYPLMTKVNGHFEEHKRSKIERYKNFDYHIALFVLLIFGVLIYYLYVAIVVIYRIIKEGI